MKVVLINPPIETKYRSWYPLGIGYIAANLIQNGFEVEVIDLIGEVLSREEFIERIKLEKAECFGIGGIITAFNNVIDIAKYIREQHPDSFIFAGNTVVYTIPEIILNNSDIEVIVLGEGEETTVDLLQTVKEKKDIRHVRGITFKDKSGDIIITEKREPVKELEKLPFPAWDLLPVKNYFQNTGSRYCLVSTVRGCPYNCTFCCKTFIDYKVRYRSPESIIAELLEFHKRYNISSFYFFDDLSMVNKKNLLKFCELKKKSKLSSMPWRMTGRINLMDEKIAKLLKLSNCSDIGFGIESLDQSVLDSLNKKTTVEQIEKTLLICEKYGINYTGSSFMIGAINETTESVNKSRTFCIKHNLRYEPHFITPFPGTQLYDYAIKNKLIRDEISYLKKLSMQGNTNYLLVNLTKNFSDKELEELKTKSLFFPKQNINISFKAIAKGIKTLFNDPKIFIVKLKSKIRGYKGNFDRYSNTWD